MVFVVFGLGLAGAAALERPLRKLPLSLPMIYVALGWLVFSLPLGLPQLDPVGDELHATATEYLTEFIVIVSLMSAGLSIDRLFSWRNWRQVVPLLLVTMPLSILAVGWLGWAFVGLGPAAAILLGAAVSPTDPVLARAVQVGPPGASKRDDVRFDLTVEAGMNDGLAFPFVYLAIAAASADGIGGWLGKWAAWDGLWRVAAGVLVGVAVGRASGWFAFKRARAAANPACEEERDRNEGMVVMASLFAGYGLAEMVEGYGFLAVFVGAVAARQYERGGAHHRETHNFIEQVEKVLVIGMLLGFGGLLAGGILGSLTWAGAAVGLLTVLLVRPLAGIAALLWSGLPWPGRWAVAFLGVRGMGTIYYLSYGQNHADFGRLDTLWAVACFIILVSIVTQGLVSRRIITRLKRDRTNVVPGADEDVLEDHGRSGTRGTEEK